MATLSINIPTSLNVGVITVCASETKYSRVYPYPHIYYVALYVGKPSAWVEIVRWEWQADRLPEDRDKPDEDDVAEFAATKLREFYIRVMGDK